MSFLKNLCGCSFALTWIAVAEPGPASAPACWTARDFRFSPVLDGIVSAVVVEPNGKVVICGPFQTINGLPHPYLARLNPDGSIDATFNPPEFIVGAALNSGNLARQSDGRLIVSVDSVFLRLNSDGGQDATFKGDSKANLGLLYVLRDDRLLVARANNSTVLRLSADGTTDPSFQTMTVNSSGSVLKLMGDSAGRTLLLGNFDSLNGAPATNFARLNHDGTLDRTFQPGVDGAQDFAVMSDDSVVVALAPTSETVQLARLDAQGRPMAQFLSDAQVVNCCGGSSFHSLLWLNDECIMMAESDCGHGNCLNSIWLFDGQGRVRVPDRSSATTSLPPGSGRFGPVVAGSSNTWYATVLGRLQKNVVVCDVPVGVTFAQPSIWLAQASVLELPILRQGDNGLELKAHFRIETADNTTDYIPVEGVATFPVGSFLVSGLFPGPKPLVNAPERQLEATLESVDGGAVFGLYQTTIHVVSDYEAAGAPYLRLTKSSALPNLSLELRHFAPGYYTLEISEDLKNFASMEPIELRTLQSTSTISIETPAASAAKGFYRVVTGP